MILSSDQFFDGPHMVAHVGGHRWRTAQRPMDTHEIVMREMETDGRRVVDPLLAKTVGQAREPAHLHPHGQVLALHITG